MSDHEDIQQRSEPAQPIVITQEPSLDTKPLSPKDKGICGWLLLLCILLTVVRGIGFLATLIQAVVPSETSLLYGFYALYFVFGTSAGILLWAKAPFAVTYAKIYYVVQPYAVSLFWFKMMDIDPSIISQGLFAIIQAAVFSVVWFSYLTFSRRVRNIYKVDQARRNVLLALVMGAVMGPLGTIYFHVRIFLMTVIATLVAITLGVLAALIFGFHVPPWMRWVWLAFYPISSTILAVTWNESVTSTETTDIDWSTASVLGMTLGIWVFRVIGISTAVYGAITLWAQHRIFLGIVCLILLPTAMSIPAKWIMTVVAVIASAIAGARETRRR